MKEMCEKFTLIPVEFHFLKEETLPWNLARGFAAVATQRQKLTSFLKNGYATSAECASLSATLTHWHPQFFRVPAFDRRQCHGYAVEECVEPIPRVHGCPH